MNTPKCLEENITLVYNKGTKQWAWMLGKKPQGVVSKKTALATYHRLKDLGFWHIRNDDPEFMTWEFILEPTGVTKCKR